jgi:hypothetical protein
LLIHQLPKKCLLIAALLLSLSTLAAPAGAAEFEIPELSTRLEKGSYIMSARIDYHFSDRVLEALENGVPLTLDVFVELRNEDAWWWRSDLLDIRLRYQLRYLPLPSVYQVIDLQTGIQQNFVTLESALDALGNLPTYPLLTQKKLTRGERYRLSVKAELDIESLPLPLRPLAYLTPSWNLSSEWRTWRLTP